MFDLLKIHGSIVFTHLFAGKKSGGIKSVQINPKPTDLRVTGSLQKIGNIIPYFENGLRNLFFDVLFGKVNTVLCSLPEVARFSGVKMKMTGVFPKTVKGKYFIFEYKK